MVWMVPPPLRNAKLGRGDAVGVISRGLRDKGGDIGLLGQGGRTEVLWKGKGTDKNGLVKGQRRC